MSPDLGDEPEPNPFAPPRSEEPPPAPAVREYGPAVSYGMPAPPPPSGYEAVLPAYVVQPGYGQQVPGPPAPYGPPPAYGQPTYGQPTYGKPGAYAEPYGTYGAATAQNEPLALASLIVSLSGLFVGLSFPVGLGLGIAALRRIKRTGAQGRGTAIGGIVVGAVGTGLLLVGVAVALAFLISGTSQVNVEYGVGASAQAPAFLGGAPVADV